MLSRAFIALFFIFALLSCHDSVSLPPSEHFDHFCHSDRVTSGENDSAGTRHGMFVVDSLKCTLPYALIVLNYFIIRDWYNVSALNDSSLRGSDKKSLLRILILLLLLSSGNIKSNPGPELPVVDSLSTPLEFSNRHGLGFLHVNARSLIPKLDIFSAWFLIAKPDVVVVSETWLKPSTPDNVINIAGFNVFRCDRKGRAGGTAIYVSEKLQVTVLHSVSIPRQLEFLAVQIVLGNSPLTIIGCYRPPSAIKDSIRSLTDLLSRFSSSELILLGDLNWDWLSDSSENFKQICDSLNLCQLINSPTRINPSKPDRNSLLDVILTNAVHKYVSIGVFSNDISDHCTIACVRSTKLPKTKCLTVLRRSFKHFSEQAFIHDLVEVDWSRFALIPSISDAVPLFQHQFLACINKHAPLRKVRIKDRSNPWFSSELSDAIHARNKQWSMARKSKSAKDWLLFRSLRNKCNHLIKKSKVKYYLTLTSDTLSNPSKFWTTVKALQNKRVAGPPQKLLVNDSLISDKKQMSNAFNSHFKKAGHVFDDLYPDSRLSIKSSEPSSTLPTFVFSPFLVSEVLHALQTLDPKKTAGPDGIDPYFLKIAAPIIALPLTDLYNLSISEEVLPDIWKQAFVSPLLKSGLPSEMNNYRPISNLCVLSKILESLVSSQLRLFLDSHSILNTMQSGFRTKHSTVTACLEVLDNIRAATDNKSFCVALFIDLTKAFDTVDHHILLNTLLRVGFSQNVVSWFKSYLLGRTQCVRLGDSVSDQITLEKGVPQGSILGPLLFLLYVNNICDHLTYSRYHMYADDTVMYSCAPSLEAAVSNLQSDFASLQHTLIESKLLLNGSKTKAMVFAPNRSTVSSLSIFTLDGCSIEVTETYKYLGIWLDKNLDFKYHIEALIKKLKFTVAFFYRVKSCFSPASRKQVVMAFFLSQLDYGDIVYRFACPTALAKLDPLYHAALRFISNSSYRTHHCILYSLTGWTSLATRRLQHWYVFIYKAVLGKLPWYICSKLELIKNSLNLRSSTWMRFKVPPVRTEASKRSLFYFGPWSWNDLQTRLKLASPISLYCFKYKISEILTTCCSCFDV